MANSCYGSLNVCMLRWSALTSGGAPDPGASNGYQMSAFTQLGVGIEISAGADVEIKNGCADICQSFKQADKVKRASLDLTLCDLDSELIQLMVGGGTFVDSGTTKGFQGPVETDDAPNGGCLEAWTWAWDGDQQAVDGVDALYWHWVFPRARFVPGTFTMEAENFLLMPLTGNSQANTAVTANGPFNDWPDYVANAGGVTASYGAFLDTAIPTATCGYVTVPSGS